jgi:osomolarity two-component system sensor histidine kinase CHK1
MIVLYLENTHVIQAFPPKRLEVLRLLCAQAAVTIEKAEMYRSMEEAKQAAEAATMMKSTCISDMNGANVSFGKYEPRNSDSV